MAEVIPLFPLSHVLVPGMPLPLHIFEPRYRQLLADISDEDNDGSFGVVALRSGTEAAAPGTAGAEGGDVGAPDLETIGTLAEILEVERHEDGTSDLLAVGSRRFRILRVIEDGAPYVRAEVDFLEEPDGELTVEQETRARELIDVYDAMLMRIAGRGTGAELPGDPNQLSYHLAARLPLPPGERQSLLNDLTTAERLKQVARLLRREIALLQRTRSIAVSPAVLRMVTGAN